MSIYPPSVFIPVKSDEHRVNSSRATSSAASDGARRTAAPRAKSGVPAPLHDRARRLAHPHPAPGRPAPNLKAAAFPRLRGRCAQRPTACVRLAPTAPPREPRAANRVEPPTSSTQITCRTHLQLACSCGAHTHGALCTIRRHLAAVFPLLTPVLLPGTPYKLLPGTPRPPRMTALGARHRRVPRRDGVSHATTVRTVSPTPPRPRRDKTLAWGRKTSSRPRAPCAQHFRAHSRGQGGFHVFCMAAPVRASRTLM